MNATATPRDLLTVEESKATFPVIAEKSDCAQDGRR